MEEDNTGSRSLQFPPNAEAYNLKTIPISSSVIDVIDFKR
jgi:hypothetical protein